MHIFFIVLLLVLPACHAASPEVQTWKQDPKAKEFYQQQFFFHQNTAKSPNIVITREITKKKLTVLFNLPDNMDKMFEYLKKNKPYPLEQMFQVGPKQKLTVDLDGDRFAVAHIGINVNYLKVELPKVPKQISVSREFAGQTLKQSVRIAKTQPTKIHLDTKPDTLNIHTMPNLKLNTKANCSSKNSITQAKLFLTEKGKQAKIKDAELVDIKINQPMASLAFHSIFDLRRIQRLPLPASVSKIQLTLKCIDKFGNTTSTESLHKIKMLPPNTSNDLR